MKSKESLASSVKSQEDVSTQEQEAKLAEQKRKQQELIFGTVKEVTISLRWPSLNANFLFTFAGFFYRKIPD